MSELAVEYESSARSEQRPKATMPLAMAGMGYSLRVVKINAGYSLCERLSSMGLVPGTVLEVLSDGCRGPMIIAVKGSRVVLGRGMAHKVLVE